MRIDEVICGVDTIRPVQERVRPFLPAVKFQQVV
jgi:hypothetical protein